MIYCSILFTIFFIYYSKYQFINGRTGRWHSFGMLMRILVFVIPYLCTFSRSPLEDYFLAGSISIVLWEIGINKIALGREWLYVGNTSLLDRKLGKKKWIIYFTLLLIALIVRII